MTKNYFLYDVNTSRLLQFVSCDESEILHYGKAYCETDKTEFNYDDTKEYFIENNSLVSIDRTDTAYLLSVENSNYEKALNQLAILYPKREQDTFPIQKFEALIYRYINNEFPTPFLDGLLTERIDTKDELIDKILLKDYQLSYQSGIETGKRQAKEKEILGG